MTNLLVVVSRVVGAGQRVGVPVPVHALASVRSLRSPVFQDGFSFDDARLMRSSPATEGRVREHLRGPFNYHL